MSDNETADSDAGCANPAELRDVLGFHIRRAHSLFTAHWQISFRDQPFHVTAMQGGMLMIIQNRPGLSQTALARAMDVETPTLLQALDKLEQSGLAVRRRGVADRRSYALHLTSAGEQAVAAVRRYIAEGEAALLADLSADERAALSGLLQRVVRRSRAVVDEANDQPGVRTATTRPASKTL